MKKYSLYLNSVILCFMLFISVLARAYVSPTPGEISIMATTVFHDDSMPDPSVFVDVENCGFNLICQNSSMEVFDSVFRMLEGTHIKLVLSNSFIYDGSEEICRKWIYKYKDENHLGGWGFKDEPKFENIDKYSEKYRFIHRLDPDKLIYLNLVGGIAPEFTGNDINTIYEYLKLIETKFSPFLWSYDFYPISQSRDGSLHVDYDTFYSDLESFSKMSKKTRKPFWAYCQSVGYRMNNFMRPVPKEEYLRFEAFSALAYGAQGIVYWTYMQRPNVESIKFEYLTAPVDRNGNKTKVWYAVRNVNREIKKYNDIFLGCEVKKVVHTGDVIYRDTNRLSGGFGPFAKVESKKSGILMSHIRNKGRNYIVMVNHDVTRSQRVSLWKKRGYDVKQVSNGSDLFGRYGSCEVDISAGGYVIYSF